MFVHVIFMAHILRLTPLFLLLRAVALIVGPSLRYRTTLLHELGFIGFCLYLSAVCYLTVNMVRILQGHFELGENYNLNPLKEIISILSSGNTRYALLNIAGNVLLFFPLGLLLPLLWHGWKAGSMFFASLFLSGGIEVLQLFTGRCADVDDVILNTLGAMLGFLAYCVLRAVCPRVTVQFRLRDSAIPRPQAEGWRQPQSGCHSHGDPGADRPSPRRRVYRPAVATTAVALLSLACAALLFSGFGALTVLASRSADPPAGQLPRVAPNRSGILEMPPVHSANVYLVSADLSEVLYEEKAGQRIYPASLTKMMTAVLALEQMGDLEQAVPLGEELFTGIYKANLSTAGFQPGEVARALDLVYGVMLPSGAECSVALAEHIAGSEQAFVAMMNEKARALGMDGTQFVNATGSHHKNHYTTASDMALLLGYALENPTFRAMAATQWHSTAPTNLRPEGISFASTLFGKTTGAAFPGGVLLGGKTGYTDEAGQCLASIAEINGREYILVTAGAKPEDFRVEQLHIADAFAIYGALGEIGG